MLKQVFGKRVVRLVCVLGAVAGGCLVFTAGSAFAVVRHRSVGSFQAPGIIVYGLAVDNSAGPSGGDVYAGALSDSEESVVYKYPAGGGATPELTITGGETPAGFFAFDGHLDGVAVDSSAGADQGDVYVADPEHGVVDRFSEAGVYLGQLVGSETTEGSMLPGGVAVNASGDVYVADVEHAVIDEFSPLGKFVSSFKDTHGAPGAVAVDAKGDIYVADSNIEAGGPVFEFEANGTPVSQPALEGSAAFDVALDGADEHVFLDETSGVGEFFFEAGVATRLDGFGQGGFALAVDESTGEVYVTNTFSSSATIEVFGQTEVIPGVTSEPASGVGETGATLHGQVTPDIAHGGGEVNECEFEYVTSAQFAEHGYAGASTVQCSPAPPYSAATAVSANVTLAASTTYDFRVAAADPGSSPPAGGRNESASETLTTSGPASIVSETAIPETTSATVSVEIDPFGVPTSCEVQYVSEADFTASGYADATTLPCTPASVGSGFTDQAASVRILGLSIGTTYHYRFIAASTSGSTMGADQTFTTFGIKSFGVEVLDREGHPYTQAGGHPYKLVTSFQLNGVPGSTDANVKDVDTELPPGLIGNVNATPKCTAAGLVHYLCPGATQVGVVKLRLDFEEHELPVYNLVPSQGVPAEFGFRVVTFASAYIDLNVRTGGDYGVIAEVRNATNAAGIEGATVEIWGVPADPSHNFQRFCPNGSGNVEVNVCEETHGDQPVVPLLSNPTSCSGPQTARVRVDAWQDPGVFLGAESSIPAVTGCESLRFGPSLTLAPDNTVADSPSGLDFELQVPQNENPEGLAESALENSTVTLPAGVSLSPSAAVGLAACSQAQIGLENAGEPACPAASKIGSVEIDTPLLGVPLKGSVYVAEQNNNPFGSVLAIYIAAQAEGARVKLAGEVSSDPVTGQLITRVRESPQVPFSAFKLHLFGGAQGSLATPENCGTFTAEALLSPWSATAPASLSSPFQISSGCVSAFAPSFTGGSTGTQAGAYTPFVASFSREDPEQEPNGLTVSLPDGLLAQLTGVPLCGEAQANAGSCPEASQVGTVQAGAGPGPNPLFVTGKVYLTGPYNGGPYGLSVVVPAIAGPFNFGDVIVRQSLRVNPRDAHVTDVSNPFPTILDVTGANGQSDGVPIKLRRVDVNINRPGFTFNPTNCAPQAITGTITSTTGATSPISEPFQASNCAALKFTPGLAVATAGHASKANGASLSFKITYPKASQGTQSWINETKFDFPIQLPSRLTTLQQACPAATFEANPRNCSPHSLVGHATVHTPVLPNPLEGPIYLVSYGSAKFPESVVILEGDNITLDLHGETFVAKNGVTSVTFHNTPDAPFESFEVTLPQGPYSVFGTNIPAKANYNLCGQKLVMPTLFKAQNGLQINQNTTINTTSCPKPKTKTKHHKTKHTTKKHK